MNNNLLFNKIFIIHKKQLKDLLVRNKKLIVCFSGIPGSGKTYISKILEKRYKAIRINNDNIRKIIKKLVTGNSEVKTQQRQEILQNYLIWFIQNHKYKNKLIILDSSIDRKYNLINKIASKNNFKVFTIQIKLNKKQAVKRAIKRSGGKEDLNYIGNIRRWIKKIRSSLKKEK